MRLFEIKAQNRSLILLSGIDTNFDDEYNLIIETHAFMKNKNLGAYRHRNLLNNIDNLELKINKFLNFGFLPDRDINYIRIKIRKYMKNLDIIKKQIP